MVSLPLRVERGMDGKTIWQGVAEFTSGKDEGVKILVDSFPSEVDRKVVKVSRNSCVARLREGVGIVSKMK